MWRPKKKSLVDFVEEKKKELPDLERERRELTEKLESSKKLDVLRQQLTDIRHKKAWADVYAHDEEINTYSSTLERLENEALPKIEEALKGHEAERAEAEKLVNETHGSFGDVSARVAILLSEEKNLRTQLKENQREVSRLTKSIETSKEEIEGARHSISSLQQACIKVQTSATQEVSDAHKKHMMSLEKEERALEKCVQELKGVEASEEGAMEAVQERSDEKDKLEDEEREKTRQLQRAQKDLRDLEKQGSNEAAKFGAHIVHLLGQIERMRDHFHRMPIGPVGMHTNLTKDGQTWALAIDEAISGSMLSFLCADSHDLRLLQDCAKKQNSRVSAILVPNLDAAAYRMPPDQLPPHELTTVFASINTTQPVVSNLLIDTCSTERQVLADDQTGRDIVFNMSGTRNVKEVFLRDGTKLFRRGETTNEIPRSAKHPARLGMDNRMMISYYKEKVQELDTQTRNTKRRRQDADDHRRKYEFEVRSARQKKQRLMEVIRKAQDTINMLRNNAPDEARSVEEEIADFRVEQTKFEQQIEELEEEIMQAEKKKVDFEGKIEKLKHELELKDEARTGLQKDNDRKIKVAEEAEEKLDRATRGVSKYGNAMQKLRQKQNEIKQNMDTCVERRDKDREIAEKICPEETVINAGGIQADETSERLGMRMNKLSKRIASQENQQGFSLPDVLRELEDVQRQEEKTKRIVSDLSGVSFNMDHMIKSRIKKLRVTSDYVAGNCNHEFNSCLSRRGATGRLNIEFEKGTLEIQARMTSKGSKAKDTKAFSGGERSFVTMAFILALATQADPPLLALDEYDIFMDDFSRKLSTTTLLEFAKESKHSKQLILITPHEIGHIIQDLMKKKPELELSDHVKILRMAAPRDNQ